MKISRFWPVVVASLFLISCRSPNPAEQPVQKSVQVESQDKNKTEVPDTKSQSTTALVQVSGDVPTQQPSVSVSRAELPNVQIDAGSKAGHQQSAVPSVPHQTGHHLIPSGTDPETALRWLKNGNRRFVKAFFRNDGASRKDVQRLASGQKPHSIVLSCSDSRVPPEIIFDQKLGEIFTVRTAGEAIEPATIGSIEYSVEHLGVRNLVVLGHTQCGAVKAALSTLDGQDAGSENLNYLVKDIHPRLFQFKGKTPSKNFADEGWANVDGVVKDLIARSKIIEAKIKSGELRINSGLYDLETGSVNFK